MQVSDETLRRVRKELKKKTRTIREQPAVYFLGRSPCLFTDAGSVTGNAPLNRIRLAGLFLQRFVLFFLRVQTDD